MVEFSKEERLALLVQLDTVVSCPTKIQCALEGDYLEGHIELIRKAAKKIAEEAVSIDGLTKEAYHKALKEHSFGPSTP